jgi:rRNA-processing protein FCF1
MNQDTYQVSDGKAHINVAVNDATLLMDLFELDLIEKFFELPIEFHVTQLVIQELEEYQILALNRFIEIKRLKVRYLTLTEMGSLNNYPDAISLTQEDLSIYLYAKELLNCMILTADNRLKKEAKRHGFEVHGILWVFEKLLENKILKSEIALLKLNTLMKMNAGISENDCNEIIKKWIKL